MFSIFRFKGSNEQTSKQTVQHSMRLGCNEVDHRL